MLNKFYIPSYQEALDLVKKTGELTFYETIQYIDGYKISVFNYRLAKYNDFVDNNAYEMRGLCYVFNLDGTLFKAFRLLHKFFNLNQVEETQFELVKDLPITNVTNKEDGSVISFIQLPNGNVLAKSKMIVNDNFQSCEAQKIYNKNLNIKKIVDYTLENNLTAVFELVSPFNRVVLKYDETELILIRLRDNNTGEYLPLSILGDLLDGVKTPKNEAYSTWQEMLDLVDIIEGIEGWVIECGGQLIKLKTKWYCDRHHLLTDFIHRPDFLIEKILDDEIDDILGQIGEHELEIRELIDKVTKVVNDYVSKTLKKVNDKKIEFNVVYNKDEKSFAMDNKKEFLFGMYMLAVRGLDPFTLIVQFLKKRTYHLSDAMYFVENGKVSSRK